MFWGDICLRGILVDMKLISYVWAYHNTLLLIASFFLLFLVIDLPVAQAILQVFGSLSYLGGFVAGIFFVSTFTFAPAAVVLFGLAENLNPFLLAVCAAAGAVMGDVVLFRFLKDRVFEELAPVAKKLGGSGLAALMTSPYFAWFAPVLGAIIIATPLPDEAGISLLGISKINTLQFMALTFLLHTTGILMVILLAQAL